MRRLLCSVSVAAMAAAGAARAESQPPAAARVSEVVVVARTPLEGATADLRLTPAPVQVVTSSEIERSHALDLTAYMTRALAGVYVNDIQNNPLQPDINYRGYTASPLLGTPQGLSVYMDGVRLNQPFGDVVSWDLIPRAAIATMTLMPGSNPLFGLNTLGGAVSIRTKDGRTAPGSSVELDYGSHDRWQAEVETGGQAANGLDWYVTANRFQDRGWREASPSKATQAFGKLGWSDDRTELSLTGSYAGTDLTGNGLQEQRFLERDYASVYTKPDVTQNHAGLVNFTATHRFSDQLSFSGNAYIRTIGTRTLNGDINDDSLTEALYQPNATEQAALTAAGYSGFPTSGENAANTPFPSWRCIANILLNDEPNEKCNGLLNRTGTDQTEGGFAGQLTWDARVAGRANQLTVGAAFQASGAHFTQSSQFGFLTPDRGVTVVAGPGAFADGTQNSEDAFDARVDLSGRTRVWSAYATDTFELLTDLHLTLSGRFDATAVKTSDAITPSGPGSLSGDHDYSRFNPAVGLTWNPAEAFGAYAAYNEGSRAPSAIEIGCSDPENPCRLPNALAGDPPLKQVVTRTVEAGVRGRAFGRLAWRVSAFRAQNDNDIMFVADDVSGFGYFKNFGRTRRQGVELGLDAKVGKVALGASYTYLDATYQSSEIVGGSGNSTNSIGPGFDGVITVQPGDHIPLVPQHVFKANADWAITDRISLNADLQAVSGVYARGNENNQHEPDGVFYLGPGKTNPYAVMNLGAEYRPTRHVKMFLQVNNLFDTHYFTAAQLGATGFNGAGAFVARPFAGPVIDGERPTLGATFYAPGAPRLFWGGVKYSF
jgi:outer membrane receptor protein involved in Fe transport